MLKRFDTKIIVLKIVIILFGFSIKSAIVTQMFIETQSRHIQSYTGIKPVVENLDALNQQDCEAINQISQKEKIYTSVDSYSIHLVVLFSNLYAR